MERKAQSPARSKLESAANLVRTHLPAHLPPVFYLTDPERTPDPVATAAELPAGWGVIYRHFADQERVSIAKALADVTRTRGLKLLIAADAELAERVSADGVHWPEAEVSRAGKWCGAFKLSTSSAHSFDAIEAAANAGIDAVLRSVVFESNSPSAQAPIGAEMLKAEARKSPLPIYGLGGIDANNAQSIANFAGLAAIEGIENVYGPKT